MMPYDQGEFQINLREAYTLLDGKVPGPHPSEAALREKGREQLATWQKDGGDFAG